MSQRQDFVEAVARGQWGMQELCARFGISRKTGYKWWMRFVHGGLPALTDHSRRPLTLMDAPNVCWSVDFKGQFRLGTGAYCYPLTVVDGYSRYLLACRGLASTRTAGVRTTFEHLFQTYGLPERIRSDNGAPFATCALARFSALSVWWLTLGIRPELIEPGHPEQNGRHERMHRTLKAEAIRPAAASPPAQQRRLNAFRQEYNELRPHEALGQVPPAVHYRPSPRPYHRAPRTVGYPRHFETRLVSANGGIRWHHQWVNVSHVLAEEYIGLEETADSEITGCTGRTTATGSRAECHPCPRSRVLPMWSVCTLFWCERTSLRAVRSTCIIRRTVYNRAHFGGGRRERGWTDGSG